jgi:hypothetical protein
MLPTLHGNMSYNVHPCKQVYKLPAHVVPTTLGATTVLVVHDGHTVQFQANAKLMGNHLVH